MDRVAWRATVLSLVIQQCLTLCNPIDCSLGFPGCLDGKEFACNAGDLSSIPELGRSPGGGHGNPSSILAWRILIGRGIWQAIVQRVAKSQTLLND